MSGKISGMIWDLDLPHAEAYVLLAMADHADHEGNNVYPSVPLIAWKTGYSERQVQRAIKDLRERKILVPVEERAGHVTRYKIELARAPLKPPRRTKQAERPDTVSPPDPRHNGIEPVTPRHPRHSVTGDIAMSPGGDILSGVSGDIAMSGGGDIAMSGGGDIAMSPVTVIKRHSINRQLTAAAAAAVFGAIISPTDAQRLVETHPACIDHAEALVREASKAKIKDPAGMLVHLVTTGWIPPPVTSNGHGPADEEDMTGYLGGYCATCAAITFGSCGHDEQPQAARPRRRGRQPA